MMCPRCHQRPVCEGDPAFLDCLTDAERRAHNDRAEAGPQAQAPWPSPSYRANWTTFERRCVDWFAGQVAAWLADNDAKEPHAEFRP